MAPAALLAPTVETTGLTNGKSDDMNGDQHTSPTDSENAERNLAAVEKQANGKLKIKTDAAAKDPLIHDAVVNSEATASSSPPTFADDPLSATALVSPLHSLNWNSSASAGNSSLDAIANSTVAQPSLWEAYKRALPDYPPSFEKLIMDYHHRHGKSWQLAHDFGPGSGVWSAILARYFRHVHISSPDPLATTTSRKLLSTWLADHRKSRGRFTFSTAAAENSADCFADSSVDLAIVMQGAHFTDPDELVRSAALTLAPNGTLAFVTTSPLCRVTGNPRADEAVQRLFAAWGSAPWDLVAGGIGSAGKQRFASGLDVVALPADLFDESKTRRISINVSDNSSAFSVPDVSRDDTANLSRVRAEEKRHVYTSEAMDEVARGWRQEVGPEFFRAWTAAVVGPAAVGKYEKYFAEIAKIAQETSPNGIMITIEWSAVVVLATRK